MASRSDPQKQEIRRKKMSMKLDLSQPPGGNKLKRVRSQLQSPPVLLATPDLEKFALMTPEMMELLTDNLEKMVTPNRPEPVDSFALLEKMARTPDLVLLPIAAPQTAASTPKQHPQVSIETPRAGSERIADSYSDSRINKLSYGTLTHDPEPILKENLTSNWGSLLQKAASNHESLVEKATSNCGSLVKEATNAFESHVAKPADHFIDIWLKSTSNAGFVGDPTSGYNIFREESFSDGTKVELRRNESSGDTFQDSETDKLSDLRERNRLASARCRQRKRARIAELEERVAELEKSLHDSEAQNLILCQALSSLQQKHRCYSSLS